MKNKFALFLLVSAMSFCLSGCGGSGVKEGVLTGTITVDGKPIPSDPPPCIYLTSTDSGGGSCAIESSGKYTLNNIRFGEYKVAFRGVPSNIPGGPTPVLNIPKNFNSFDTSGVTVKIDKKSVTFDYDIKSKN